MQYHNLPIILSIQLNIHSCYIRMLINFECDTEQTTYDLHVNRIEIYIKIQKNNDKSI